MIVRAWRAGLALGLALLAAGSAQAHLMAAQKGTLNLVGDAGFLVLSVPVAALQGVDDDGDGALSRAELAAHRAHLEAQVAAGVQLRSPQGPLPLQLLMADVAAADDAPGAAGRQLVVLGRFALRPPGAPVAGPLTLAFTLFGQAKGERQQDLTITRGPETQWLRFEPERITQALLPGRWELLAGTMRRGAEHVLGGADHLLFLAVVLVAGGGWRRWLGALSSFTTGHALTLAACVVGGLSVPVRLVEPAIAATIVGMAGFDAWGRWQGDSPRPGARMALVFACALVHGLGLASGLSELTAWPSGSPQLAWALLGFNLGIEAAQVGVAALVAGAVLAWQRLAVPLALPPLGRHSSMASFGAMVAGAWWFVERVVQGG